MKKSALLSWAMSVTMLGSSLAGVAHANEGTVYFATGSNTLDARSLQRLRDILRRVVPGGKLALSAHTDPRGSKALNARLREERARVVKDALIEAGASAEQIAVSTAADQAEGGVSIKDYWRQRRVGVTYEEAEAPAVATTDPKTDGKTDPKTDGKTDPKTDGKTDPKTDGKTAAKTDGKTDGKTDPKTDGKTDGKTAAVKPPEEDPVGPDGKKLEKIRLIYWKQLNHALWIVAKEKGFFAEEGFNVTLEEVDDDARVLRSRFRSEVVEAAAPSPGVRKTDALNKGQKKFTAGAICGYATHEGMSKGEDIVDIGSMVMISESLIMKKELAEQIDKDIHGFKGHKIGDIDYGGGEHAFLYTNVLKNALAKLNIVEKKDYTIDVYHQWDKLYTDLVAGKLDMIKGLPPYDTDFVRKNPEYVRVPFARFFPYIPCCRQLITRGQLKDHREKYVRLLRASIRAHEYVITHPRESSEVIARALKMPAASVRASIMNTYTNLTPDPMRKGIELYQRANEAYTKTKTSTAEYVDTSLYRDALLSLQKENEADPVRKGYYATMVARFRQNN